MLKIVEICVKIALKYPSGYKMNRSVAGNVYIQSKLNEKPLLKIKKYLI